MKKDENGYIVVETVGSFTMLVLLMWSILTLINIVTVQARVHYALSQTAQTISMYCYTLEKNGLADPIMKSQEKAESAQDEIDTFKGNLNNMISAIDSFKSSKNFSDVYKAGEGIYNSGQGFYQQGQSLANQNPKDILQEFLNYGIDQAGSALFEQVLQPLMNRYLKNGELTGDEYLKAFGVEKGIRGLDFTLTDLSSGLLDLDSTGNSNSKMLDAQGNVRIIVSYEVDYTFGALPLPFTKLKFTQEVITKAWLGGNGEGYIK